MWARVTFNAHIIETGTQSYRLATSKTSSRKRASSGLRSGPFMASETRSQYDGGAPGPPSRTVR